jgi:hypothetical protein
MTTVAILLAVASSCCAAVGAHLQYMGVRRVSFDGRLGLRGASALVRDRQWTLGLLALLATAVFQVLAISMAPLVVVQPVVVLALPLIAVLNARSTGRSMGKVAGTGVLATSVGLAAGVALAAALPRLPFAGGLATMARLAADVCADPLVVREGALEVARPSVEESALAAVEIDPAAWRRRGGPAPRRAPGAPPGGGAAARAPVDPAVR